MKHTVLMVSCLSLGLGAIAAGCSTSSSSNGGFASSQRGGAMSFSNDGDRPVAPRLRGAAVGNFNKGYVDGVNASAFFNKGQPLSDQQVDRLIEIGRRQGDPTGLLALPGYADGYRTGAKHSHNPYENQMAPEQVAQVRKVQGLPEPVTNKPVVRAPEQKEARKDQRKPKAKQGKDTAEAAAR